MLAALVVMVQGGTIVLVNPQEPVLAMLSHTRTNEMFTIQRQTAETTPDIGMDGESSEKGARPDDRSRARARVEIRGPHSLPAGIAAFLEHEKFHGTGEEARPPRPAQVSAHR